MNKNNPSFVINLVVKFLILCRFPSNIIIRFHDEWTDLQFVRDVPVIDHYDYRKSKVYHAAVDFGDVIVKSINIDHLQVIS